MSVVELVQLHATLLCRVDTCKTEDDEENDLCHTGRGFYAVLVFTKRHKRDKIVSCQKRLAVKFFRYNYPITPTV